MPASSSGPRDHQWHEIGVRTRRPDQLSAFASPGLRDVLPPATGAPGWSC